jgi:glycosyltransferase involved in cell wall biosynthesis
MPRLLIITEEQGHGGIHTVTGLLTEALRNLGWTVDSLAVRGPQAQWRSLWRKARQADVLLASNNFLPAYVAVLAGAVVRRPSVVWVHGPLQAVLGSPRPASLKHRWLHWVYRRASMRVCVSHTTSKSLQDWMSEPQWPMQVIHNPSPAPSQPSCVADGLVRLGFVGRLSPEKRPALLLQTLQLLPSRHCLTIVGEGPLMKDLEKAGSALMAQGRLLLAGAMPADSDLYGSWDLTLMCSAYEGYPMAALESLAAGVACVSTPLPALQEMLGPEAHRWIARDDSAQALARAIEEALQMPAAERCTRAHALAQGHDQVRFALQWHGLLQSLLPQTSRGSS